jgi:hypothetical protein
MAVYQTRHKGVLAGSMREPRSPPPSEEQRGVGAAAWLRKNLAWPETC